ncbi:gamma-glutamyl-gamma-aminobutyrate hydrolase family protein [Streptococcaceae bacterium ESL0729]|nr:gamma-glutamyl-gamma-aminobutyrate hydrolase family protein [Streptococcaceae bacterium ESL0729]
MAIIGIAGTTFNETEELPFHGNKVIYTRKGFTDVIQDLGHTPIIIPQDQPEKAATYMKLVDRLLLTGGEDVSPRFYGEEASTKLGKTDSSRDLFEFALIDEAVKANKPILGICRGLQVLNVKFGGSLYQDISLSGSQIKHLQIPTKQIFSTHPVKLKDGGILDFLGKEHWVNSFHHQAVKELAPGFDDIAYASDGLIEAIHNKENRALGIQWHPEATWDLSAGDKQIFSYFLNQL